MNDRQRFVVHGTADELEMVENGPQVVLRVVHDQAHPAPFDVAWVAEAALRSVSIPGGGRWPVPAAVAATADWDLMVALGHAWGLWLRSEGWTGIWGADDGVLSDCGFPWPGKGMREAVSTGLHAGGLAVASLRRDGLWYVDGIGCVAEWKPDRPVGTGVVSLAAQELVRFHDQPGNGGPIRPTHAPDDAAGLYDRLADESIVLVHDPWVLPVMRSESVHVHDPFGTGLDDELLRQGSQVEPDPCHTPGSESGRGVRIWVDHMEAWPDADHRIVLVASSRPDLLAEAPELCAKIYCPDLEAPTVRHLARKLLGDGRWLGRLPFELTGAGAGTEYASSHFGTEQPHPDPRLRWLDRKSVEELARLFLEEEARAIEGLAVCVPALVRAVAFMRTALGSGHRVVYIGAGSAGRAGLMDAVELPPTFGVPSTWVVGILAGGPTAFQGAREGQEDSPDAGRMAIREAGLGEGDALIALTAHGNTPYVLGAVREANERRVTTIALVNNRKTQVADLVTLPIEMPTGPEILVGSTRLKAGTAEKVILNLLSTVTMVGLGRTVDNLMVDFKPANDKLRERAYRVFTMATGAPRSQAERYLAAGSRMSLKDAIAAQRDQDPPEASP